MKRCPYCGRTDCAIYAEDGGITEVCSVTGQVIEQVTARQRAVDRMVAETLAKTGS